ncbi:hypothetical protein [Caviibacterium pharyngocola]|uniref:Uncharacterized protein n=1 Tax=Caviibacterium pharyngocola TaxID=28159 RepID=A0A2M8RYV5_9PAST|nr:hypothetical protein [Caviibacterium pharyngocola]PJG84056.1 hypothetical protein CVP04_00975 [Caviibacterium pharyngocola]
MNNQNDLFDNLQIKDLNPNKNQIKNWYFITNHYNFGYMLAAGFIQNLKMYGIDPHFDLTEIFDGNIVLYPDNLSLEKIENYIEEENQKRNGKRKRKYTTCFLMLNINEINTKAKAFKNGEWIDFSLPAKDFSGVECLLFSKALPISLIKEIKVLNKKQDDKALQDNALDFANIPLNYFETKKIANTTYRQKTETDLEKLQQNLPHFDTEHSEKFKLISLSRIGSLLAVLYQLGNQYDFANKLLDTLDADNPAKFSLYQCFHHNEQKSDPSVHLLNEVLHSLIFNEYTDAKAEILTCLQNLVLQENVQHFKDGLLKTIESQELSFEQRLEKYPNALSASLVIFFAKDNLKGILSEAAKHNLKPETIIYAAIFFAASQPFFELDRNYKPRIFTLKLTEYLSALNISNNFIKLPKTLLSLLSKEWTTAQEKYLLSIVKQYNHSNISLDTIVNLNKLLKDGEIKDGRLHLKNINIEQCIEEKFDRQIFLQELKNIVIDEKLEMEIRKKFE